MIRVSHFRQNGKKNGSLKFLRDRCWPKLCIQMFCLTLPAIRSGGPAPSCEALAAELCQRHAVPRADRPIVLATVRQITKLLASVTWP
jgi:hypothetical protein